MLAGSLLSRGNANRAALWGGGDRGRSSARVWAHARGKKLAVTVLARRMRTLCDDRIPVDGESGRLLDVVVQAAGEDAPTGSVELGCSRSIVVHDGKPRARVLRMDGGGVT